MKGIYEYFRDLFSDQIFWRVCVTLIGIPFVIFACIVMFRLQLTEPLEWFGMLFLVSLGVFGGCLVYVSVFGDDEKFENATKYIHDGGDLLGILLFIAAALLAIPITICIRYFNSQSSNQ